MSAAPRINTSNPTAPAEHPAPPRDEQRRPRRDTLTLGNLTTAPGRRNVSGAALPPHMPPPSGDEVTTMADQPAGDLARQMANAPKGNEKKILHPYGRIIFMMPDKEKAREIKQDDGSILMTRRLVSLVVYLGKTEASIPMSVSARWTPGAEKPNYHISGPMRSKFTRAILSDDDATKAAMAAWDNETLAAALLWRQEALKKGTKIQEQQTKPEVAAPPIADLGFSLT